MWHCRWNGNLEHEKALACPQCPRNIVIGAVYACDTRPGEHGDREPGSERNQEYACAKAGRENEERQRQPSCRGQRSDEPQDRMDPIICDPRPADCHSCHEPYCGTEKIAG